MALCTRADVEAVLGGQDLAAVDARITTLIELVQGHMEGPRGADRPLEAADHTETFDGGLASLWAEHTPINTITSITEDGTVLAADDWTMYPERGKIVRLAGGYPIRWRTTKPRAIVVVYNGGFTTVPDDLRKACAEAVARLHQAGVAAAAVAGEDVEGVRRLRFEGSDEVEYLDGSLAAPRWAALTELELATAAAYRRPGVA